MRNKQISLPGGGRINSFIQQLSTEDHAPWIGKGWYLIASVVVIFRFGQFSFGATASSCVDTHTDIVTDGRNRHEKKASEGEMRTKTGKKSSSNGGHC